MPQTDQPAPEARVREPAAATWAGPALLFTAGLAIAAKIVGVLLAPGARGVAGQRTVELLDLTSATLAYTLTAMLVALVCTASFELARATRLATGSRGAVVAFAGLVLALASPAVVTRLPTIAAEALAVVTTLLALIAGASAAARAPQTRVVGAVIGLLALCAAVRLGAWELATIGSERPSPALHQAGRVLATIAVALHVIGVLFAAAWLGTRSRVRGRLLANTAIILAFAITYAAARTTEQPPSTVEAILRASLTATIGVPLPYGLASASAFLVPASLLLAAVALVQRGQPPAILAALALALVSHGTFDVPLHALAVTAAAQWSLLATTDQRSAWAMMLRRREDARRAA